MDPFSEYQSFYHDLCDAAERLQQFLGKLLGKNPKIAHISCRAKTPESFGLKAAKTDGDGGMKYTDPLYQIQDQIGARIVVRCLDDVEEIAESLERFLTSWEWQHLEPKDPNTFGYVSRHWIFSMPTEAYPERIEGSRIPACFELQLRTLLQHAWAEVEHSLRYKSDRDLTHEEEKGLAAAAALVGQADNVLDQVRASVTGDVG